MTDTVRSKELDINGIPKLVHSSSGVPKTTSNNASGSVTNMFGVAQIDVIVDLIKAPGVLFNTNAYGLNPGVAFLAIIGTILAVTAIALGVPDTMVQAPPSMIFGFAPNY
jgi:hypothetical protein